MSGREAKYCVCHTCNDKVIDSLGIMSHRAMHRRKREDCDITFSGGDRYEYTYSDIDDRIANAKNKHDILEPS